MQQPRGCSRSPSRDKFTFFSFEFEFIATGGRLAKVPNGNLREDDPLIKGPSLQYGRTAGASVQHQTVQCNGHTYAAMHFLLTVFCCAEARKRKGTESYYQNRPTRFSQFSEPILPTRWTSNVCGYVESQQKLLESLQSVRRRSIDYGEVSRKTVESQ